MAKFDVNATAALIGVSTYQLWNAWIQTAPSLADLRAATPGDDTHQKLLDATYQVGGLVAMIGIAFGVASGDWSALMLMGLVFGALVFWSYQVLDAYPVG